VKARLLRGAAQVVRALAAAGVAIAVLVAMAGVVVLLFLGLRLHAPAAGEWAAPVGGIDIGVPSAMRLATTPWFAPWLNGRRIATRHGSVLLGWDAPTRTLSLECAPCRVALPALGAQAVPLARLRLTVQRTLDDRLSGTLEAAPATSGPLLRASWHGQLTQQDLQIEAAVPATPIADWYAVLAPGLPELRQARIAGSMALQARLSLPQRQLALRPEVQGFTVEGLGTEALLGARSACGPSAGLGNDSWLARAVIAAEDQRFFEHPGYDLVELGAAFEANQVRGGVVRGGSTVSQQLAKLLLTGSERDAQRKLRELLYAVEMERTLGKARVLQLYLDNAPWGAGVCGAEAAAQRYFGRSARALAPAQAVWLAAMLHNPGAASQRWARDGHIDLARARWVAEGVRGIRRSQRQALLAQFTEAPSWQAPAAP